MEHDNENKSDKSAVSRIIFRMGPNGTEWEKRWGKDIMDDPYFIPDPVKVEPVKKSTTRKRKLSQAPQADNFDVTYDEVRSLYEKTLSSIGHVILAKQNGIVTELMALRNNLQSLKVMANKRARKIYKTRRGDSGVGKLDDLDVIAKNVDYLIRQF